jgi:Ceramidase
MKRNSIMWLSGIALTGALFLFTSPYPQSPDYYLFADTRTLLSVPNFWNVVSNLPFLFVGIWGYCVVLTLASKRDNFELRNTYLVFFIGVFLTAFGSSYFHFEPGDETLFWDRLPMTISFAGLFAAVIGEYGSKVTAQRCLPLFLIIGIGSVLYWQWTESIGAGDLRPYAIVQFLPMLVVPAILVMNKGKNDIGRYIWLMIVFYVVAKVLEQLDVGVYEGTQFMSGHALKHVAAAVGPAVLAVGLSRRIPRQTRDTAAS